MGQGARAARHGRRDSHRSAARCSSRDSRATSGTATAITQAAGLITQEAFKRGGRSAGVPGADRGGAAAVAAAEAVHGRRARERGLDDPRRHRRVRSGARRLVSDIARLGLSFQRSQNSGRFSPQPGPSRVVLQAAAVDRRRAGEGSSVLRRHRHDDPGTVSRAAARPPPAGADGVAGRHRPRDQGGRARHSRCTDPSASAPALARALAATRSALTQLGSDPDVAFAAAVKEQQIADAIHAALGISLSRRWRSLPGRRSRPGRSAPAPPAMPPVVPGQTFEVRTVFTNRSPRSIRHAVRVIAGADAATGTRPDADVAVADASPNEPIVAHVHASRCPTTPPLTRPYFSRQSIQEARYTVADVNPALPCRTLRMPLYAAVARTRSMACRSRSAVR